MPLPGDIDSAIHAAYIEAMRLVASVLPDATTERARSWFLYDAGVENPEFNVAAVAGDPWRAAAEVDAVAAWFTARATDWRFKLRVGCDDPVIAAIRARALEHPRREPFLVMPLGDMRQPAAAGLTIERVKDDVGLQAYDSFDAARGRPREWSIAGSVMALPRCSLWLGRAADGTPAARAMAVATAPTGSIHNVVVAEPYRRRGFGRAITTAALIALREGGCATGSLGASDLGYPVYRAMGFEHRYDLATFAPAPRS